MAMLAERRRKRKVGPNPCGKWWSEDSNKFGQRMLEKMGWSKGKGLGINEQGITQHIHVSQKNNTNGLGYDENEAWAIHEKKYNELLQQLGERMNGTAENLESKSNSSDKPSTNLTEQRNSHRNVKKRNATKFTPKDLAGIFGNKDWINKEQSQDKKEDTICTEETIEVKSNNGLVTIDGGSMVDYFKHKSNHRNSVDGVTMNYLANKPNKGETSSIYASDNIKDDSESENEQRGFGFGFLVNKENTIKENVSPLNCKVSNNFDEEKNNFAFDNPCLNLNSPDASETDYSVTKRSSKKRKKKCESDSLPNEDENCKAKKKKLKHGSKDLGFTNLGLDLDVKLEESCNGKKCEVSTVQFGLENQGLDLTDVNVKSEESCNGKEFEVSTVQLGLENHGLDLTDVKSEENCSGKEFEVSTVQLGLENHGLDLTDVDVKSEKSCNGKEFEVSTVQLGLENHGLDLTDETSAKKRVTFNNRISIVEFCASPTKGSRKVLKKRKTNGRVDPHELERKERWTWTTATTIPLSGNSFDNELSLSYAVEEKKKRKKVSNLETIQESPEQEEVSEVETKIEVNKLNANSIETSIENKKSKKKKKKKTVIEHITATISSKTPVDSKQTEKDENKPEKQKREEVESSVEHKKKKKKKKDKNIVKIKTDISSNQEDTKVLDQIKQQQNACLIENMDTTKVKVSLVNYSQSVTVEKKEEKEPSESVKPKKKKRKIATGDEKIVNNVHQKAISDKENTEKDETPNIKKLKKKKKNKETKDEEFIDTSTINVQEKIENTNFSDTSLSWNKDTIITDSVGSSCRTKNERMSKKMLMALYHRKAILNFPGSNIYAIKGYGEDIDC